MRIDDIKKYIYFCSILNPESNNFPSFVPDPGPGYVYILLNFDFWVNASICYIYIYILFFKCDVCSLHKNYINYHNFHVWSCKNLRDIFTDFFFFFIVMIGRMTCKHTNLLIGHFGLAALITSNDSYCCESNQWRSFTLKFNQSESSLRSFKDSFRK